MILAVLVGTMFAERITENQAREVAEMQIRAFAKDNYTIESTFPMLQNDQSVLAYVFQLNPAGFVIVSPDTDINPVIGYSFRNQFDFNRTDNNTGYLFVEHDLNSRLELLSVTSPQVISANNELWNRYLSGTVNYANQRDTLWPPEGYSDTEGWVETQWNQSPAPYNSFCPIDPTTNNRSVTGCTATALSQILFYHMYIGNVSFTDDDDYTSIYTNPPIYIDDQAASLDFPTFPELNVYLSDLMVAFAYGYPITNEMISALNFGAGVSVETSYSSNASGAYTTDVYDALLYKFGYDTASFTYYANATFYNNLRDDMMAARPALFGILSNGSDGHAIVCDGWNEDNDYFHLNMGWGGSWDGWYDLPSGMPSGYNEINSAVFNIEGGTIPFQVNGMVYCDGAPLDQTYITLDGPRDYELQVTDPSGYFTIPYVHAATYDVTAYIELDEGGYYYINESVTLDEGNSNLIIYLDDYSTLSGTVSAPVNTENTHVNIYQNNVLITSSVADASGNFEMPGVMPGEYQAVASLAGNYFEEQYYTVSATNQNISFNLVEYPNHHTVCFAGDATDKFQFLQDMSCGICLTGEDIADYEGEAIAKMSFMAPFNPEAGEIYAQLWKGTLLVSEKQVTEFTDGEWKDVTFDDFAIIDPTALYYVGYRIHSLSGAIAAAWHDAGPNIAGKGGFIRTANWLPLPAAYDFNFCIKGKIITLSPGGNDNNIVTMEDRLGTNYPNPFNPTTTISYNLAGDNFVELSVYNLKGQLVRTLVDSRQTAGTHSVEWNGKDNNHKAVSSGIYFYKMQVKDGYSATHKMILLK